MGSNRARNRPSNVARRLRSRRKPGSPSVSRRTHGDVYAKDRCCWCYRPVQSDAAQLRLTRDESGEWFVVAPPGRAELPDEKTFGHFTLPIGPDCLRRHPEFRPGLIQPAAPCVPQGTDGPGSSGFSSSIETAKPEADPSGYLAAAGRAGLRVVPGSGGAS
jgi:hypothetical protein